MSIKFHPNPVLLLLSSLLVMSACSEAEGVAPVSETAPSGDKAILESDGLMSDGSNIPVHQVSTIETTIPLTSEGQVGGVAVDRDGNVYNANFRNFVWRTRPGGETVVLSDEFVAASGNLALDDGDLLQSDYEEARVYRVRPDGSRIVFAEGGMVGPVGLLQRKTGDFIVADYKGPFLARIGPEGGQARRILEDPRMQGPNGLTQDDEGNIYIADLKSGIVFKWTPSGDLEELTVLPGAGNAHNVFANGALYVNKIWDHVIYRVDVDTGVHGIVAGNGTAGYDDGLTGVSTIEEPNGIATNAARDIVYFNTHRGRMARQAPGFIILRSLQVAGAD